MKRSSIPQTEKPAGGANVSAAIFLDQKMLAERMLGEHVINRALETMPIESKEEIDALLPLSWVSIGAARDFHVAVASQIGEDLDVWHRRLVRAGLERTFTTIWRFLARMASIEALVKRAATVYERSYDTGTVDAVLVSPGFVRVTLTQWPDIPDFEIDAITMGIEVMLELARKRTTTIASMRTPDGVRFDVRSC